MLAIIIYYCPVLPILLNIANNIGASRFVDASGSEHCIARPGNRPIEQLIPSCKATYFISTFVKLSTVLSAQQTLFKLG